MMIASWGPTIQHFRRRHGVSQHAVALLFGVSQRTISRWERGDDQPSLQQQKKLRELGLHPSAPLLARLTRAVECTPVPRALSCTPRLRLLALSKPAIAKRPTITTWIGRELAPIASGVLQEMLDDSILQRAIRRGEVACVETTTRSVLRTVESPGVGTYRTTVSYFFHDGMLFSDAVSAQAPSDAQLGYRAIMIDD
jgi:transcriptional regulator with XRE-family HTH domain